MPDPTETAALRDRAGFATVEVHPQLTSTMERARELAADVAAALPALVAADRQTAGHGRQGAPWWQAEGSLAVSIVVDDQAVGVPVKPTWSLACGVALAEAIAALEPTVEPHVKWPNDLTVGGHKLAGILLETAPAGRTILGIGVNTTGSVADAPPPLRDRLTTLPDLTGRSLSRADLLVAFLPRFLALVRAMHAAPEVLVDRYRVRCGLTGQPVTVYRGADRIEGVCGGIAINGSLVVDTATGRQWLTSGSLTAPPTHTPPDRRSRAGARAAENPRP
jgi:BirA family transcriptional regulator, biotin operon repressor / biotin---[acetyl-CoA-carboxylase] ligase